MMIRTAERREFPGGPAATALQRQAEPLLEQSTQAPGQHPRLLRARFHALRRWQPLLGPPACEAEQATASVRCGSLERGSTER